MNMYLVLIMHHTTRNIMKIILTQKSFTTLQKWRCDKVNISHSVEQSDEKYHAVKSIVKLISEKLLASPLTISTGIIMNL